MTKPRVQTELASGPCCRGTPLDTCSPSFHGECAARVPADTCTSRKPAVADPDVGNFYTAGLRGKLQQ